MGKNIILGILGEGLRDQKWGKRSDRVRDQERDESLRGSVDRD